MVPEHHSEANRVAKQAREIASLIEKQIDLLEALPVDRWTESQLEGYCRRQHRISDLSAEIAETHTQEAA
jgi:hypothetical protein